MTEEIIRRRAAATGHGATRVVLPGRCRADLDRLAARLRRAGGARPGRDRGPARPISGAADGGSICRGTMCGSSPRSSTRPARTVRGDPGAGTGSAARGRRRDRPRRPARHAVSAPRGQRPAAQGGGLARSASIRSPRRTRARRPRGRRLSSSASTRTLSISPSRVDARSRSSCRRGPATSTSLVRACERLAEAGRPYLADPILEPIHFGFVESLARYAEFRRLMPDAEMLMGTGNLTELTEADSLGITALLMGIVLGARASATCSSCR